MNDVFWIVFWATVFPGLTFVVGLSLLFEGIERKLVARLQNRMGPSYTGLFGLLQPLLDVLKLLGKEDIVPRGADSAVSSAALVWALSLSGFAALFIPWMGRTPFSFEGDVLMVGACLALSVALLCLSALSFHSPYPVIGGMRLLGLIASYEIGFIALLAVPYALTGSLSLAVMREKLWSGLASNPLMVPLWLAALVLGFMFLLAEAEKDPFTMAEAETEVAGGYLAEFTGRRLAFAHLTRRLHETVAVFLYVSALLAPQPIDGWWGFVSLLVAGLVVLVLLTLVDAAAPRLRLYDIGVLSWNKLLPLALLVATGAIVLRG